MNDVVQRLECAIRHVEGRPVFMMPRPPWEALMNRDGLPTLVTSLGAPLEGRLA
jgi:hypothetical protein